MYHVWKPPQLARLPTMLQDLGLYGISQDFLWDIQEVRGCRTRGVSEESVVSRRQSTQARESTLGRRHQKPKTVVSLAPQKKGLMSSKKFLTEKSRKITRELTTIHDGEGLPFENVTPPCLFFVMVVNLTVSRFICTMKVSRCAKSGSCICGRAVIVVVTMRHSVQFTNILQ